MTRRNENIRLGGTSSMVRNRTNDRLNRIDRIRGIEPRFTRTLQDNPSNIDIYDFRDCLDNGLSLTPTTYNNMRVVQSHTSNCRNIIRNYNYIPDKFNFNTLNNEKMYLGIELEVDDGGESQSNSEKSIDILGEKNCYVVHDGSLNNGFEIVTHPCSISYHKKLDYKNCFKFLIDKSYKSDMTKTCGLHIHVNRNYFGNDKLEIDLNIVKIMYFIDKYKDKIEIIARRKPNGYSRAITTNYDLNSVLDLLYESKMIGKYASINLKHKDTIEFRMFKGTLNFNSFMATIEFVRNMVDYCKSIDFKDIENLNFGDALSFNKNDYLDTYYIERVKIYERKTRLEVNSLSRELNQVNTQNNQTCNL